MCVCVFFFNCTEEPDHLLGAFLFFKIVFPFFLCFIKKKQTKQQQKKGKRQDCKRGPKVLSDNTVCMDGSTRVQMDDPRCRKCIFFISFFLSTKEPGKQMGDLHSINGSQKVKTNPPGKILKIFLFGWSRREAQEEKNTRSGNCVYPKNSSFKKEK